MATPCVNTLISPFALKYVTSVIQGLTLGSRHAEINVFSDAFRFDFVRLAVPLK